MNRSTRSLTWLVLLWFAFAGGAWGAEAEKKKEAPGKPITITANRMEANRRLRVVTYLDNVVAKKEDLTIYAQRVEFLFDEKMEEIQKITAEGGVRIVDPDKSATATKAIYLNDQDVLVLTGSPKVWQGDNLVSGYKITLFRKEGRSVVEGGEKERVFSIFYPGKEGESSGKGILPRGKPDQEKPPKSKGD